jgi:hypothetical protein
MILVCLESDTDPLSQPSTFNLRWTAQHVRPRYELVESWFEVELLVMMIGQPHFPYLIVEDVSALRFAQAMGEPDGMIVEVCEQLGTFHPRVMRLRRSRRTRLPNAALTSTLFTPVVHPDNLFTSTEASGHLSDWLSTGAIHGAHLEPVLY